MKIVFAGTPEFAATALRALVVAHHDIALVMTQPDRPAGRGLKAQASPVKRLAEALGLPVAQPQRLANPDAVENIAAIGADVMVVAAYGLIIPGNMLTIPRLGCINIHASLLPRWRGAAPIQRAILAGDVETGITIMQMDEGLDTGPVLLQQSLPVAVDDTAQTLHDRLAVLGAELIVEALARPGSATPQDPARATYATKLTRDEARIDWGRAAVEIDRQIRAFNPVPGAYSSICGMDVKVWAAVADPAAAGLPGTVCRARADGITVATGLGGLRITLLQRAGGKRLSAAAFLAGYPIAPGSRFEA